MSSNRFGCRNGIGRSSLAAALLIACASLLTGCGDDKKGGGSITSPQTATIVGTWKLAYVHADWAGGSYDVPASEIAANPYVLKFRADGTCEQIMGEDSDEFEWMTQDATVLIGVEGYFRAYTYSVTSTQLVLQHDFTDDDVVYHVTERYARVQ